MSESAAAYLRQHIDAAQADILEAVRRQIVTVGRQWTCQALIELTGSVLAEMCLAFPEDRSEIEAQLSAMALYVATSAARGVQ